MSLTLSSPLVLAAAARRRRQRQAGGGVSLPDGNTQLVSDLGGDAAVLAFYDVRAGITLNGSAVSQWDDCRGASGYGPSMVQATAANQPAFSGTGDSDYLITCDGSNDRLASAEVAAFDLSAAITLVLIGSVPNPGAARQACAISNSGLTRYMAISATPGVIRGGTIGTFKDTLVATAATRRVVLVAKNNSNTVYAEVPAQAQVSNTGGAAVGSGSNAVVLGALSSGGTNPMAATARAMLVLSGAYSAGQRASIKTWAETYHSSVAA